ncbi:MAG TPA: hypothetical protein P5169_08370, partial [Kiritimatiellia bacterium]|nr:hypothetical protein [Kiritimatiellia bacterium]
MTVILSELLRVIQFYNSGGYHCADPPDSTEDGYVPGPGAEQGCTPHDSDYNPQNWIISLSEVLRVIQFYNLMGYYHCPDKNTEDGFCPAPWHYSWFPNEAYLVAQGSMLNLPDTAIEVWLNNQQITSFADVGSFLVTFKFEIEGCDYPAVSRKVHVLQE